MERNQLDLGKSDAVVFEKKTCKIGSNHAINYFIPWLAVLLTFPSPTDILHSILHTRSTPIHSLPTEILAHIFALLSPHDLGLTQLVSRAWRDVISDEASWRVSLILLT